MIVPNRKQDIDKTAPRPANVKKAPKLKEHYGWSDALFYMLLWGDLCHEHHIYLQDLELLNESDTLLSNLEEDLELSNNHFLSKKDSLKELDDLDMNISHSDLFKEKQSENDWLNFDGGFDFEGFDF